MPFIRCNRSGEKLCRLKAVQSAIRSRTVDSDDNYGDATCDKLTITTSEEMDEGDRVLYEDPDTGEWAEWVVKVPDTVRSTSMPVTTYKCVSSFEYDLDGKWIEQLNAETMNPADYLASVLTGTAWGVGTVEAAERQMSDEGELKEHSAYKESGIEALHGLCNVYGYEMYPTVTMSPSTHELTRTINLVKRRGSATAVWKFEYHRDLKEIRRTYSGKRVLTKAHVFGKGQAIMNDLGVFTGHYDHKITIAEVNDGKDYLEDTSLIPYFGTIQSDGTLGHTEGRIDFEQCEDVAALLVLGQNEFENQKAPNINYEASVVALARAGMEFGGCDVGDSVQIVDKSFPTPLRMEGRVVAIEEDLLQGPASIVLTIGNIASTRTTTVKSLVAQMLQAQLDHQQTAMDTELTRQSTETVGEAADVAATAANTAIQYAGVAQLAAESAGTAAQSAAASAATARSEAADAMTAAVHANTSANDALTQLSVVQDVAGTLSWISDHGSFTATSDTSVVDGRVYFELENNEYVPVVEPTGDPHEQGWYVLDVSESQSDYIMAHLAVTSAGLWILPSGLGSSQTPQGAPGYKMLLSSSGSYLYDGAGHLVTTYGESITFDSSRPQYIGGENAYIAFFDSDDDGTPDSIRIGGSNVIVGSNMRLSEILDNVSTTIDIISTAGTVFKSSNASTTLVVVVHHGADRIETQQQLAAVFGIGSRIQWSYMRMVDQTWQFISADDERLSDGGFRFAIDGDDVTGTLALQADVYVP